MSVFMVEGKKSNAETSKLKNKLFADTVLIVLQTDARKLQ